MKFLIVLSAMMMLAVLTTEAHPSQSIPSGPYYREERAAISDLDRVQRQAGEHHHDAVDFGAHTGHHGAFGWYADFPVHAHGH